MELIEAFRKTLQDLNGKTSEIKRKKLDQSKEHNIVHVGRSPSLSSFFEKQLAENLSEIPSYSKYDFYVDYPISLLDKNEEKIGRQNIYPDIMVVDLENNVLKAVIEIKLDLGYVDLKKEMDSSREEKFQKAKRIEFNSIVGAYSDEEKNANKKINLKISENLRKIAVIVTTKNDHKNKPNYTQIMKKEGYYSIFILENIHFNSMGNYSEEIDKELEKPEKIKSIKEAFRGI